MVNLITDHIDVWSSAQTKKNNGAGRGNSSANNSQYGINKLRELILELAVSGKLVQQNPNDEPASALLERIAKEKARLINEGKFKKQEPLPAVTYNGKHYKLPNGWIKVRLGNIANLVYGKNLPTTKLTDTGFDVFGANGIIGKHTSYLYEAPQVLISCRGAYSGKANMSPKKCFITNNSIVCELTENSLNKIFLYLALSAINKNTIVTGSAQPQVTVANANPVVLAVPPLAEQNRIVAKVDELMAICDQLEQKQTGSNAAHQTLVETVLITLTSAINHVEFVEAWQRIANYFDTLFTTEQSIDQLKQAILQLAVMGKLVPQDPNDEPASALLKKIADEKARLTKEGKIKKGKPLPEITDENKPFELAESWVWIRLGAAGIGSTGTTPSTSIPRYYDGEIPFIGPGQISPEGDITEPDKTLTIEGCEYSTIAEPGDILMVCIGGSIGKSAIIRSKIAFNQQINCIRPLIVDSVFLNVAMKAPHFQAAILDAATGSATPIINRSKWEELLIPLPPLAEQHRIVAKVDQLMAMCDTLKARLQEAQNTQIQLADTMVEHALI